MYLNISDDWRESLNVAAGTLEAGTQEQKSLLSAAKDSCASQTSLQINHFHKLTNY